MIETMRNLLSTKFHLVWQYFFAKRTRSIEGFLTIKEGRTLFKLARNLPPGSKILEVGSYKGRSTVFLSLGIRLPSELYCIDTWLEPVAEFDPIDNFNVFQKNIRDVQNRVIILRGKSASQEVINRVPENLSLLFVDAGHNYEDVLNDLSNYLPKVRHGGIVVLHDYFNPCDVKVVADGFIERGELKYHNRSGSMAICKRK